MGDIAVRQRSLLPLGQRGPVEGWMANNVASATQLFGSGPSALVLIGARDLLTSTARVIGSQLGALHFKAWMALITLHVAQGMPADGRGSSTAGEFSRMIWDEDRARGGSNARKLLHALFDLRQVHLTVPGCDLVNQRPALGVSDTSHLINLYVDETDLKASDEHGAHALDRAAFGKALANRRGMIAWRMHPDHTRRLGETDLRRFDRVKAQQRCGVALARMTFGSPRSPYRPAFESTGGIEMVEVPLTLEHGNALGVHNSSDAGRRRSLNEAGRKVCAADKSFEAFEAHGGRGRDSFLPIMRKRRPSAPLDRPLDPVGQLDLAA